MKNSRLPLERRQYIVHRVEFFFDLGKRSDVHGDPSELKKHLPVERVLHAVRLVPSPIDIFLEFPETGKYIRKEDC